MSPPSPNVCDAAKVWPISCANVSHVPEVEPSQDVSAAGPAHSCSPETHVRVGE